MSLLDNIKKPVEDQLLRYEAFLKETLRSEHEMTHSMLEYIFENRGKAIRPLIVLLTASIFAKNSELPEDSLLAAMLVEMMHTASLVHDDVIDEANIRRGKPSAKAMWRSHRAVLIGDYILAKSYSVGMAKGAYDIISSLITSMTNLCEGELLQSDQSDKLEMTQHIYKEIIFKKTASLFGTCSCIGPMSVMATDEDINKMRSFGDDLGMAFQIKDDILDYSNTEKTGKPACADLKEKKITLPLLTTLENASDIEKKGIIELLRGIEENPGNAELLHDMVTSRGGIEKASVIMNQYIDSALETIASYPESEFRSSLENLCEYVASREK